MGNSFIAVVTGGNPPYSYNWSGPIHGNSEKLQNLLSGSYTLTIIDSLGCKWQKQINYVPTDINSLQQMDLGIIVYPNPSSDLIWIKFNEVMNYASIQIYDVLGRRVKTEEILNQSLIPIKLASISSGTYFLQIITNDLVWNRLIFINR